MKLSCLSPQNHLPKVNSQTRLSLFFRLIPYSLSLIPLFVLPAFSQQTWRRTYGGSNDDQGYSVQQTQDGGYIVTGETYSFGAGAWNVYLIKTNASGDTLWTRTYGWSDGHLGNSVQQTSDGGYIIAGTYHNLEFGWDDVYIVKTNAAGDTLWTRTYGGAWNDQGYSVQQTSEGGYIIAGWTNSFGAGVYLIKTDASGDTLWTKTYGGSNATHGYSVQQTLDGGYIVTGTTSYGNGDVYLIKTDASGDTLWTRTYGGTNWDLGNSVHQTSDGGYIIAGFTYSFGPGWPDVYLIKTNASGDTLWTRAYGGTDYNVGNSIQQTSDGGYIVAGTTSSYGAGSFDVYLIKTNATGDTLWTRTFGRTGDDRGYSVQQTTDGGYIVAGWNGYDVYLVKTDTNGFAGVEEKADSRGQMPDAGLRATPNPFTSFAWVPGHSSELFALYDISGRKVGVYKGDRIGEGLGAGVYFLRPEGKDAKPLRIVKLR